MRGPLSIVAGLVMGVVVGGLLFAGLVVFAPVESIPSPRPSPALASPTPGATASASSSSSPSPVASVSPSAAASDAAFHVSQMAAARNVPQVAGLKAILPGVDVTP